MNYSASLAAGFVLVITVAACAVIGLLVADAPGLLVGLAVGFVAGFVLVYRMYLKPLRDSSLSKDYSHLKPDLDDDR